MKLTTNNFDVELLMKISLCGDESSPFLLHCPRSVTVLLQGRKEFEEIFLFDSSVCEQKTIVNEEAQD